MTAMTCNDLRGPMQNNLCQIHCTVQPTEMIKLKDMKLSVKRFLILFPLIGIKSKRHRKLATESNANIVPGGFCEVKSTTKHLQRTETLHFYTVKHTFTCIDFLKRWRQMCWNAINHLMNNRYKASELSWCRVSSSLKAEGYVILTYTAPPLVAFFSPWCLSCFSHMKACPLI